MTNVLRDSRAYVMIGDLDDRAAGKINSQYPG